MHSLFRTLAISAVTSCLVAGPGSPAPDLTKDPTLYVLNYSHLDTQWRWAFPWTIKDDLRATLYDNFAIMDQDPGYVFNWTGASRYQMFKEYYPAEYQRLKGYVAKGQWFPSGSAWEESDVNVPSSESLVRQILMGHWFFKREFGTESSEYMLPDCFGFPASLPSVLAHCGLKGFSTQKLTWGSAVGIPFNIGRWQGPDGNSIVAAFNPGSYAAHLTKSLQSDAWVKRLEDNGRKSGVKTDLLYNGNGDEGGAPFPESMKTVQEAEAAHGPIKVISGRADLLFNAITPAEKANMPVYQGDLLLTQHSAGSLTSEAFMKRLNRTNELLADGAEKASAAAQILGAGAYPAETLDKAWGLTLRSQFHDMLPGTCLPVAYEYCWNDGILAAKAFQGATADGVGAVARGLDTRVEGVPLVVFNALGTAREDLVEALVPAELAGARNLVATGTDGKALPTQLVTGPDGQPRVLFPAKVPAVGFAVFGLKAGAAPAATDLKVMDRTLENALYRVTLNEAGDLASVFDKKNHRELLSEAARQEFHHEKPRDWPAWNMDWADRVKPPTAFVGGTASIHIIENGPVRVAIQVERETEGSRFVQTVSLAAGAAGDRVEVANLVDWKSPEASLKAAFALNVANAKATYNWDLGTVQRTNNDPKKYEVPTHGWMDLTDTKGDYGVTVLTGAKYGSDKPADNTLRLTLLYSPGVRDAYREQRFQDWGRHAFTYGLAGHAGSWQKAKAPWLALRQDQPLQAFAVAPHAGALGRQFSLFHCSSDQIAIQAVKRSEDGASIVVRLQELNGAPVKKIVLHCGGTITSARELDGLERPLGDLKPEQGALALDFTSYQVRTLGLTLQAKTQVAPVSAQALPLPYNLNAFSPETNPAEGMMDGTYSSYPSSMIGNTVEAGGVTFAMGPRGGGKPNAVACQGQTLTLPEGTTRVHLLMAATDGDQLAEFKAGAKAMKIKVPDWALMLGAWDNRIFEDAVPDESYSVNSPLERIAPAFLREGRPAWWASHRLVRGRDEVYSYGYLFSTALDVPAGTSTFTLPVNGNVKVFAVTAAATDNAGAAPLQPLFPDFTRDETFKARFDQKMN